MSELALQGLFLLLVWAVICRVRHVPMFRLPPSYRSRGRHRAGSGVPAPILCWAALAEVDVRSMAFARRAYG